MELLAGLVGLDPLSPRLIEALTHPSLRNEQRGASDYQRLEFLGDAVLELCCSQLLYERFPSAAEGTLTQMRARLVNASALAEWGAANGVAEALRMGRGADAEGLRRSENVLSDAVEALIAAAYLDGGLAAARAFCAMVVAPSLAQLEANSLIDPKSSLQQEVQALGLDAPTYRLLASGGPAHEPWFEVAVQVGERVLSQARGRSKRLAERAAAEIALREALFRPQEVEPPLIDD